MTVGRAASAVRDGLALDYRYFVILAAAAAVMGHELVFGISWSDSLRYNLVWTEQFVEQLRAGDPYPRWLASSWTGLGSPTFYIYPPLYFWAASLIDLVSFGLLPTTYLVPVTSFVIVALSGVGMYLWLARRGSANLSLAGAILYVAAPYHLNDIYSRGALAEATVYAVLPFLLLAFSNLAQGRRRAFLGATFNYAALILAHLPSALIVSLFVLGPFVLFRAVRESEIRVQLVVEAACAVLLGLGLSAFYLLPALTMMPFVSQDAFFGAFYQPETWFIWNAANWPRLPPMAWTLLICAVAVPLLVQSAIQARRAHDAEPLFWCAVGLVTVVMALGLVPLLWQVPMLDKVQFPYRFLLITEFTVITAVLWAMPRIRTPLVALAAVLWILSSGLTLLVISSATASIKPAVKAERVADISSDMRDAPEYLPGSREIAFGTEPGVPQSDAVELPASREIRISPGPGSARVTQGAAGRARVEVSTTAPATLTLRRFFFPHWHVTDTEGRAVLTQESPEGLLSWRTAAGKTTYYVDHGPVAGERTGQIASLLALLLLVCAAFVLHRSVRGASGPLATPTRGE